MNKPITVIYEDFKKELADLINNSGLPAFIVETVLQSYLIETGNASKRQYQLDKARYEEFLSKENKDKEN